MATADLPNYSASPLKLSSNSSKDKSNSKKMFTVYTFESNSAGGIVATLLQAKANFKVKKLDVDDWEMKKAKFDYETLPILKYEDILFSHEIPILLFLGRKFGLLGDSHDDEYEISEILYAICDLKEKILPAFLPESKEEFENQQVNLDVLIGETMPFYLKKFEDKLGTKRYFFGDKISIIDIYMGFFIFLIFKHPLRVQLLGEILHKTAPNLDNLTNSLVQNEMKEYFKDYFEINSPL